MNAPYILYRMALADFLERVRRYSFLVTLAGALYLAWNIATEKVWLVVGNGYRGVYNSAWIGTLMAICCSTFLSLVGFYIVKNSIQRDTETRVGLILAATPMRKPLYTLAKALSNFAVLGCMVLILMLAALAMQFLRSEGSPLSLWQLWSPFLLLALPSMALTASLALLFETLPILNRGVGNILYFFLWVTLLAAAVSDHWDNPAGLRLLSASTRAELAKIDPSSVAHFAFSLTIGGKRAAHTFLWNGIHWTAPNLLDRLAWIAVAVALALLASVFFTRFDPAKEWLRHAKSAALDSPPTPTRSSEKIAPISFPAQAISASHLAAPLRGAAHSRFLQLAASELRLMLKGQPWWWYAVAAGLLIAQLFSPLPAARTGVLLVAWIWPVLIWSQMGCREQRHATDSLLFSSEHALTRQLPALWTAGVLVAAITGGGIGLRLLLIRDWQGFAAWISAVLFIPSLALMLGIWSGSRIPFEALYTVWWYVGPMHQLPALDFMGTTQFSSRPLAYAVAAGVLLALSYWKRRMRIAYA